MISKKEVIALLVLAAGIFLFIKLRAKAQTTQPPPPAPPPSGYASVSVTVVDGNTGAPIPNVAVSAALDAMGNGAYEVEYTDSNGYALLSKIKPGCLSGTSVGVYVYLSKIGYQPRSFAVPCLNANQLYPLGTIPMSKTA